MKTRKVLKIIRDDDMALLKTTGWSHFTKKQWDWLFEMVRIMKED